MKLKDFWPVLTTLLSTNQAYPLGDWSCVWKHDVSSSGIQRPEIHDTVTINFSREEIVTGSGRGGQVKDGYRLVGRCTSSCVALTYRIADEQLPYAGSVMLHKITEKRLEGHFIQYIIAADGTTAGLLTGTTVWQKA